MPRARDLLARFRPVGAPGAAAPAGVPADRVAERERELQPVFDELAATEEEAARICAAAAAEAAARSASATDSARVMVDDARRDSATHRTEAAAVVLRQARQETAATRAGAEREASAIADRAQDRLPALVARVVDAVLADVPAGIR